MIQQSMPLGLTRWVQTGFPLSITNAERGCAEMLKQ